MKQYWRALIAVMAVLATSCKISLPTSNPPPPSAPATRLVTFFVDVVGSSQPVSNAVVFNNANKETVDLTGMAVLTLPNVPYQIDASAPDCDPLPVPRIVQPSETTVRLFLSCQAPWPQPVARAPLVLEGNDPTDGNICHTQELAALSVPPGPAINWWRADAWGVTVSGLPFVSEGSSHHPERVLTWFFDRWDPPWQQQILATYRQRGYTHFVLSWPDSRDGNGLSVAQYVATTQYIKTAIPYVAHFLSSKDYDPPNADAPTRMAAVAPVVDALVQAHAADILIVGWELDLWNDPQLLQNFIDALSQRYPGVPLYVHFSSYKTAWQLNGEARAQFWQTNRGKLTGLLYQGNAGDSCGDQEAHFDDAQDQAAGLAGFVLVPFELVAWAEFDGDHPNEDDANARSWAVMNTPPPAGGLVANGFGNGGRYPDGTPTLSTYVH